MALRHVTDEEIQEYLDGKLSMENRWIPTHLENCEFCKKQLSQYQNLYVALNREINFSLSPNFSESVIARIHKDFAVTFKIRVWHIVLSAFGLMIGAGTALYFIELKPLLERFILLGRAVQKYFNLEVFLNIKNYFLGLNINLSLLGFAIIILLVMSAIDHFIIQSKHKLITFIR
ncbi:MAG: anti-sigma factor family protein [bacterium]